MNNLILLVLCFAVGILLRRIRRMPDNAPATLNSFIIHVSLPALTLQYLHHLKFGHDMLLVIAMPWLVFGLSFAFFWFLGRTFHMRRGTVGALILTGGLANTAFFGVPMVEAFYGHNAIGAAILLDQLGSFLVLSILGITVAGIYSSGRPTPMAIGKRIVLFPPFIAFVLALALNPVEYPAWLTSLLQRLGDTLAPLALLSIGLQLRLGHLLEHKRHLALGLGFKLLLAPLVLTLLYVFVIGAQGISTRVTLFEAGMPPMVVASIIASEHDLDPELATLMVAAGLLVSFFTLGGWWYVLQGI